MNEKVILKKESVLVDLEIFQKGRQKSLNGHGISTMSGFEKKNC